jgi:hypothetical protein
MLDLPHPARGRRSLVARATAGALLGIAAVLVLTAASPPSWLIFRTDGIEVRYPPAWFATTRQLTPVDDPPQVLAIASYRFPSDTSPNGCNPAGTLAKMPASGALIFVIEYASASVRARDFPPRRARFRLGSARRYECFGPRRSYLLRFRDAGRSFQVDVAFGQRAGAGTRTTVLRILDSFRARAR